MYPTYEYMIKVILHSIWIERSCDQKMPNDALMPFQSP